jgi:hypothetical protein
MIEYKLLWGLLFCDLAFMIIHSLALAWGAGNLRFWQHLFIVAERLMTDRVALPAPLIPRLVMYFEVVPFNKYSIFTLKWSPSTSTRYALSKVKNFVLSEMSSIILFQLKKMK